MRDSHHPSSATVVLTDYGADTGAFDRSFAALGAQGGGVLLVPPGTHTSAGGHRAPANVTLRGVDQHATTIVHTGDNAFVTADYAGDLFHTATFEGFRLVGNSGPAACGLAISDRYKVGLHRVHVRGYTAGEAVRLSNIAGWTEGTAFRDVHLRNNLCGVRFVRGAGTDSFAETIFDGLAVSLGLHNAVGIDVGAGTYVYGGKWNAKFNIEQGVTGAVCVNVDGRAEDNLYAMFTEGTGGHGLKVAGTFNGWGHFQSQAPHVGKAAIRQGWAADAPATFDTGPVEFRQPGVAEPSRIMIDFDQADQTIKIYRWTGVADSYFPFHLHVGYGRLDIAAGGAAAVGAETVSAVVSVEPGKVGFLGATPAAPAAAVTIADVHAALVELGLITAT